MATCTRCVTAGGPDKEHGAATENSWGEFGRGQKEEGGDDIPANLPEALALEFILAARCVHHQEGPWVRPNMGQASDNPETNPPTIKPETVSHVAEQFSWAPWPSCSLPGRPFPIMSLTLSARVSPRTIPFWVLDKSPLSGPGRGPLPATWWSFI